MDTLSLSPTGTAALYAWPLQPVPPPYVLLTGWSLYVSLPAAGVYVGVAPSQLVQAEDTTASVVLPVSTMRQVGALARRASRRR